MLSADALVHQYWMWQFRDAGLFHDPLTEQLRESARYPPGYVGLFWLATRVTSPITFGEWLGVGLMALSAWLIFLIVRAHADWRPAAWIAAALFLALIELHRFNGGFPRAFVHPTVLLTVLLSVHGRYRLAAVVAAGGALFYQPAGLLAVGVLCLSALAWRDGRPALDGERTRAAVLAGVLGLLAVFVPQLLQGASPAVLSAAEARRYPEFGVHGTLHFFADDLLTYLSQNRSGFDLRQEGSILAVAALALLLVRRANVRLLHREVLAMPLVSLLAYAAAQAVLFRLYLPHRFTYPLVAFFSIVVAVTLRPTWQALWERSHPRVRAALLLGLPTVAAGVALYAFPVGPLEPLRGLGSSPVLVTVASTFVLAVALGYGFARLPARWRAGAGALVTGAAVLALLIVVPAHSSRGTPCPGSPATRFIATLPEDAVIAGDPEDLQCIPAVSRRAVVISSQLAPAYERDYFLKGRDRMFRMLRAYYGPEREDLLDVARRYEATHLLVRRTEMQRELAAPKGRRWPYLRRPYGVFVRDLAAAGRRPAVLDLPEDCRRFRFGGQEVYDLRCVSASDAAPPSGR